MKSKDKDIRRIPEWITNATNGMAMMKWLLDDDTQTYQIEDHLLIKVKQDAFYFLYYIRTEETLIGISENMEFCGLYNRSNYMLYDVSCHLIDMMGLPKDVQFPDKTKVQSEAEENIRNRIQELIMEEWDQIIIQSKSDFRKNRPLIVKKEMEKKAECHYLEGMSSESLVYQPTFSFGLSFLDAYYYNYLTKKEKFIDFVAWEWCKKNALYVFQQKIITGCIREELKEIERKNNHRIHKIKRLRDAIQEGNHKHVTVYVTKKGGNSHPYRIEAKALENREGSYSISHIPPKERTHYYSVFGKHAGLQIEQIEKVVFNRQCLYEANN